MTGSTEPRHIRNEETKTSIYTKHMAEIKDEQKTGIKDLSMQRRYAKKKNVIIFLIKEEKQFSIEYSKTRYKMRNANGIRD